jgi:uncharacterized protein involved in exopolysaccharide biosynthesis
VETVEQNITGSRESPSAASKEEAPTDDVNLLLVLNTFLRHWRVVVGIPAIALIVAFIAAVITPPTFTATSTFVPEAATQSRLPSSLSGLAGQFGINLGSEPAQSPRFYADLVRSREIMEHVLLTRFHRRADRTDVSDSATLIQFLPVRGRTIADSLARGVKQLRRNVSIRVNPQTNVVTISVDARDPDLAADVTNTFVQYLNDFNASTRQSRARERRKFVEQRVSEGERDLRRIEAGLMIFYERNRSWQQSPQLTFQEGALRRSVQIQQELYLTLKREYETARIEEVNDTPVITVIDHATPPRQRSKPRLGSLLALTLVFGTIVGALCAVVADQLERARILGERPYQEFKRLVSNVRDDILAALRSLRRRGS